MPKYQTLQRKQLLDVLQAQMHEQFSAKQLLDAMKDCTISLSAIYRNLAYLEEMGAIRRSVKEGSREIFYQYMSHDGCRDCIHLTCKKCGDVMHANSIATKDFLQNVRHMDGFDIEVSGVRLQGICDACNDNKNT